MDFDDTPEEASFRKEVRAFLDGNAERRKERRVGSEVIEFDIERARAWQAKKAAAGFAGITLPRQLGGRGGTPIQQVIFNQEELDYYVPRGMFFVVSLGICIPTMIAYASADRLERYVKPALQGKEIWCQLFSEPGAGSDLAGVRTRAERHGDEWSINGQKIWTSGAQYADFGLIITRTDPGMPKHEGLTAFYLDMKSPGITVSPIKQMSGESHFNEVFLDDVRIPDEQRLGNVGEGWKVALHTLLNERLAVGHAEGPGFSDVFAALRAIDAGGMPAVNNPAVRDRLADWYVKTEGLKYTTFRVMTALSHGRTPGPEASIIKIVSTNKLMETASFVLDQLGMAGAVRDADIAPMQGWFQDTYLRSPGDRIAGGTEEIMLNIIAERVLGLPGEIRVDKDVPFNRLKAGKF
jgi:alkylation response protein AidB-like acyl-CoA dehydrogenase